MTKHMKLEDGRLLEYHTAGAADGFPLIWFHGTPGSYTILQEMADACKAKGLKLIAISRPGYAGSTRNIGRRVVDIVPDVKALTTQLGIKKCLVGGWSGGGPHSLACAARLPGCVGSLVVAGVGPYNADGLEFLEGQGEDNVQEYSAAEQGEDALRQFVNGLRPHMVKGDVDGFVQAMSSILPDVDKKSLAESSIGPYLVDNMRVGITDSTDGWIDDDLAFINPWGFDVSDTEVPVLLYHGSEDKMVPFAHGKWLVKHMPRESCESHLLTGEGHISVAVGKLDDMLERLRQHAK